MVRDVVVVVVVVLASLLAVGACGPAVVRDGVPSTSNTVTTLGPLTYYRDCVAARDADALPLRRGDRGYRPPLDRDGDGVACDDEGDDGGEDD